MKRSGKGLGIVWYVPILLALACSSPQSEPYRLSVPASFDSLPPIPSDNPLTGSGVALGRLLFFDERLSENGSVSCASCHLPSNAYADSVAFSMGIHGRRSERNTPSLINVAYQQHLFMEGGVPSLELQVLGPMGSASEMNLSLRDAAHRLNSDADLRRRSIAVYGDTLNAQKIAFALADYQRSLVSRGAPIDAFLAGNTDALPAAARAGMALFQSEKAACASCHSGFLFTDQDYHNTGLAATYQDPGRQRLTLQPADRGKFKTPSLRNVALTAPYMHDGSIADLRGVLNHYNSGGAAHPNKDKRIRELHLTPAELSSLEAFLQCLTDSVMPH